MKPTMKTDDDGTKRWFLNGKRHREDGPAVEWCDGIRQWYLNDKRHREDGPAVEYTDGAMHWFLNGEYISTTKDFQRKAGISGADMTALVLRYGQI